MHILSLLMYAQEILFPNGIKFANVTDDEAPNALDDRKEGVRSKEIPEESLVGAIGTQISFFCLKIAILFK